MSAHRTIPLQKVPEGRDRWHGWAAVPFYDDQDHPSIIIDAVEDCCGRHPAALKSLLVALGVRFITSQSIRKAVTSLMRAFRFMHV